jgi:hypothetical protein
VIIALTLAAFACAAAAALGRRRGRRGPVAAPP